MSSLSRLDPVLTHAPICGARAAGHIRPEKPLNRLMMNYNSNAPTPQFAHLDPQGYCY
jgi:hypothetical protein